MNIVGWSLSLIDFSITPLLENNILEEENFLSNSCNDVKLFNNLLDYNCKKIEKIEFKKACQKKYRIFDTEEQARIVRDSYIKEML